MLLSIVSTVPEASLSIPPGAAKVMATVGTKFAVIVPGPPIVAVVEIEFWLPKVIEELLVVQLENAYPVPDVAVSGLIVAPLSYHVVLDGDTVPVPLGLTVKLTCHWVL